jgi:hypothetical protein
VTYVDDESNLHVEAALDAGLILEEVEKLLELLTVLGRDVLNGTLTTLEDRAKDSLENGTEAREAGERTTADDHMSEHEVDEQC